MYVFVPSVHVYLIFYYVFIIAWLQCYNVFLAHYRQVQVFIFHPAEHYQHYLEHYMAFCGALLRPLYPILPSIIRQHLNGNLICNGLCLWTRVSSCIQR